MDRRDLLSEVLRDMADGSARRAAARCALGWLEGGDPAAAALAAVTSFWHGEFALARSWGRRAVEGATDDEGRALGLAALALAGAGDLDAEGESDWSAGVALLRSATDPEDAWWAAVRYLLAEAALVCARVDDARSVVATGPMGGAAWSGHPFASVMAACVVRTHLFAGDVELAGSMLPLMRAATPAGSRLMPLTEAVAGLVLGNADDVGGVSASIDAADTVRAGDRDFVDRGALLLLAFAAIAIGDAATAGRMVFRAGDDADLSACTIIDRALGLEILVAAALAEEDLDAAETWFDAMAPLASHPSSMPTVERARSRVLLARGDVDGAVSAATGSIAGCLRHGRAIEAAEGEIVLARARIAAQEVAAASRELRALVRTADTRGHHAVRRSAGVVLHSARRRLPPAVGAGWPALSEREQEIARHVLAGLEVDEVAARLFLSPATVRAHLSRVLCAFGTSTRIGLLVAMDREGPAWPAGDASDPPVPLSPRQSEVAREIARGATNQQIAETLGISVKGVEKHVGDIRSRWGVESRFELARIWRAAMAGRTA
jgi:DNA-binding NarL/FixJ family response regulator